MNELNVTREFYKWLYNRIDHSKFCEILEINEDSWSLKVFQLAKTDFGSFVCNYEEQADKLYRSYKNS
jgi:hypothetical protein